MSQDRAVEQGAAMCWRTFEGYREQKTKEESLYEISLSLGGAATGKKEQWWPDAKKSMFDRVKCERCSNGWDSADLAGPALVNWRRSPSNCWYGGVVEERPG